MLRCHQWDGSRIVGLLQGIMETDSNPATNGCKVVLLPSMLDRMEENLIIEIHTLEATGWRMSSMTIGCPTGMEPTAIKGTEASP